MAIRDRGNIKWQLASFLPLAIEKQRDMYKDQERTAKPMIDEYEAGEFELRIIYAMEYSHAVKLTIWNDGFTSNITGRIHYVDPSTHEIRIEVKPGEFEQVAFDGIIGVKVIGKTDKLT
jgi:hypothetical protein